MLLYETTDADFAERALAALGEARIPCYKTTTSVLSNKYAIPAADDAKFYLFLERPDDYRPANDILIRLGAAVDLPPKLPSIRVLVAIAAVAVVLAAIVAIGWAHN